MHVLASRRDILRAIGGLAGWAMVAPASSNVTAQATAVRLGDTRDLFDAALGPGADMEGGLVRYVTGTGESATYYVRFSIGVAEHVDVDLSHIPGGGISVDDTIVGDSRFLPDDIGPPAYEFAAGSMQMSFDAFNLTSRHSPSLAETTRRSGDILVVDQHGVWGDGMSGPPPYHRATVSMESFDVHVVIPHGGVATIGTSFDAWRNEYGQAPASQRGLHVAAPPVERLFIDVDYTTNAVKELDLIPEIPLEPEAVAELLGSFLPADAVLEQTFWAGPSPASEMGLRTRIWTVPSLSTAVMAMVASSGDEATGVVSRLLMATAASA